LKTLQSAQAASTASTSSAAAGSNPFHNSADKILAGSAYRRPHESPNVCQIYEIGESNGMLFIAMELVEGETLSKRISRGPMGISEAISVALGILNALAVLHCHLLHRDLKPENVWPRPRPRAPSGPCGTAKRPRRCGVSAFCIAGRSWAMRRKYSVGPAQASRGEICKAPGKRRAGGQARSDTPYVHNSRSE
jgi:serine/threonine protein kinase